MSRRLSPFESELPEEEILSVSAESLFAAIKVFDKRANATLKVEVLSGVFNFIGELEVNAGHEVCSVFDDLF